jgi:hypothetical protein
VVDRQGWWIGTGGGKATLGTDWEAGVFVAIGRVRLGVGDGAAWG